MDTKNLYFFQVVFEEGNIRTAAQKLYISPSRAGENYKRHRAGTGLPTVYTNQVGHNPHGKRHLFL